MKNMMMIDGCGLLFIYLIIYSYLFIYFFLIFSFNYYVHADLPKEVGRDTVVYDDSKYLRSTPLCNASIHDTYRYA